MDQSDAQDASDAQLRSDQIDVTGAVDFLSSRPPYHVVDTWVSSDDLADATFELNVLALTNGTRTHQRRTHSLSHVMLCCARVSAQIPADPDSFSASDTDLAASNERLLEFSVKSKLFGKGPNVVVHASNVRLSLAFGDTSLNVCASSALPRPAH